MKKIIYLFISLFVLSSCVKEENTKSVPVERNKDAVLLYLASDNNLYSYAVKNIGAMEHNYDERAPKQLLVYMDVLGGDAQLIRVVTTPKGETSRSEILKTYKRPNSSDPKILSQVIQDAQACIGENRITDLVLWSHGRAWMPYNYSPLISVRDEVAQKPSTDGITQYSFGGDNTASGDEMNIDELATALSNYKFDNILFDACYMSSIEVLYQLRNSASCIIASPAEVLADGFPYAVITSLLVEQKLNSSGLAKAYFDFYDTRTGNGRSATVAVVDCSKLEPFAAAVKIVIDKYAAVIDNDKIRVMVGQYQRAGFVTEHIYDLKTYITEIIKMYGSPAELIPFEAAFDALVIYEAHTPNFFGSELSLEGTHGISGYIPNKSSSKYVDNMYFKMLEWGDASGLSNMLK